MSGVGPRGPGELGSEPEAAEAVIQYAVALTDSTAPSVFSTRFASFDSARRYLVGDGEGYSKIFSRKWVAGEGWGRWRLVWKVGDDSTTEPGAFPTPFDDELEEATEAESRKPKSPHYRVGKIEPIDVIEDWGLGFHLGNVVKYIARAGHKDGEDEVTPLKKARSYLDRQINRLEGRSEW